MANTASVSRNTATKVFGVIASTLFGLSLLGNALVAGDGIDAEWLDVTRKAVSGAFIVAFVVWIALLIRDYAQKRRQQP